jgi:hypothetical protein
LTRNSSLEAVATRRFKGKYTRLDIRFKAQFCYIDAYQEPPKPTKDWPPKDWPETREEYLERLRNTPVHLCRLRYFGDERWHSPMTQSDSQAVPNAVRPGY